MGYTNGMFHVVDDTDFICEVVTAMLKHLGHDTMSFSCPKDYISLVNSPDFITPVAVFTDVEMPEMNGYEMMNAVSKLKPDLKFVVMTGEPKIRSEHVNMACMYLSKPFKSKDFIRVVDNLLRCDIHAPSDEYGCAGIDNREIFPITNWSCPHKCSDCS